MVYKDNKCLDQCIEDCKGDVSDSIHMEFEEGGYSREKGNMVFYFSILISTLGYLFATCRTSMT